MSRRTIARVMRPNTRPLDEDSASRLLQGLVHPDDAPPGYGSVARLLSSAARLPLAPVDEDASAATVSAMVEAIRTAAPAPQTSRRKSMLGKILAGKALAAFAVVGLTATGAAAATGSLPEPAQNVVAGAVSHVGIDIPHNHGKSADHRQDGAHRPDGESGDDQGQPGDDSANQGQGSTISDLAHNTEGPKGPTVCKEASDGKCKAGAEHGKSGDDDSTPPSSAGSSENHGKNSDDPAGESGDDHGKDEVTPPTTPTTGSIETGDDHSGGRAEAGSDNSGKGSSGSDD